MAGELADLVRAWRAHLIVTDAWVYAGPLAAQLTGVPLVRHLIGPDLQRASAAPGLSGPHDGDPRSRWPAPLVEVFDRVGVPVRDEYADALVDPCPESLQLLYPHERIPARFVPYNGPGTAPAWLREPPARQRVCLTWGTMTGGLASQRRFLLTDVLDAVAELDAEVVLAITSTDAERLGTIPDGVRLAGELPLHLLLPTCDAVVHQGGSGTLLTAAAFGVPQVVIAEVGDQTLNAAQLTASGAGVAVDHRRVGETAAAVATVLSEEDHRQAALRLRKETLGRPTPAETVHTLEDLVGKDRA